MRFFPSLRLHQWTSLSNPRPSTRLKGRQLHYDVSSDAAASHLAIVMIALSLLHSHHYDVESRDNITLLCPPPLNTIKTLLKQHTKEGHYELSLSLSLRVSIHSQSLTWASDSVFGQPIQTSMQRSKKPKFRHHNGNFHCHI